MRLSNVVLRAACAGLLALSLAPVQAEEDAMLPFYAIPFYLELPPPGDVVRSEPMTFAVDPLRIAPSLVKATRVLYSSVRADGSQKAVSGTVLVPTAPWSGAGARPLIAVAPGTQGMGNRCAPSRVQSSSFEYENVLISGLLARGYAVTMTDYMGLGTAGTHTYMNRVEQARAVLDSIRAAQRLVGSGLSATGPVGLAGYSQGGGAAAAAAELAATYAPELKIKGAAIGAPPADLAAVSRSLDSGLYTAFELFGALALADAGRIDLSASLTPRGREVFAEIEQACVFDAARYAFLDTRTLTVTGERLSTLVDRAPFAALADAQRIGRIRPSIPVQIHHSLLDDVIPYAVGRRLGLDWCARGANVSFRPLVGATHVGAVPEHMLHTQAFFEARFAGWPQWSSCGWF